MLQAQEAAMSSGRAAPRQGSRASARLAREAWLEAEQEASEEEVDSEGEDGVVEREEVEEGLEESVGGGEDQLEEGFEEVRRIWGTRPGGAKRGWKGWEVEVEWEERHSQTGEALENWWIPMEWLSRHMIGEARKMAMRQHGVGAQGQKLQKKK